MGEKIKSFKHTNKPPTGAVTKDTATYVNNQRIQKHGTEEMELNCLQCS